QTAGDSSLSSQELREGQLPGVLVETKSLEYRRQLGGEARLAVAEHPAGGIDQPQVAGHGASGDQADAAFTTRAMIVDWHQPQAGLLRRAVSLRRKIVA